MTGSTGEAITRARFPDADIKSFDDIMDAVAAMRSGQLDAAVTGFPAALQVSKTNQDLTVVAEPLDDEDTAIALRQADTALRRQLDAVLDSLRQDGTLSDLTRRWFKEDLAPYDVPAIPTAREGELLKVGVSATREPFSFVDESGSVTGHDGELARRIGAALGRPIEFVDMKFMALIPALQSGKVDVIITGMTATPERAKQVAFTRPYFANRQVMIVRRPVTEGDGTTRGEAAAAGSAVGAGYRQPTDLATQRVGVLLGSAHETFVLRDWPRAEAVPYRTMADLALAVRTGKVAGGLSDAEPLRELLREDRTLDSLGGALFTFPVAAGFASGNAELQARFDRFLASIRADGTYDAMRQRWMETPGGGGMPTLTGSRSGPPLSVAVAEVGLPFVAVRDGRLVGFDIELAERFAAAEGRQLRLTAVDFGALIASVASGKADVIIASIFATEERARQIRFSAPYFEMATQAFVRRSDLAGAEDVAAPVAVRGFRARLMESVRANLLTEGRWRLLAAGLNTTVLIALLATVAGTLLGALVCAMRMSARALWRVPARMFIAVLRGTPVLVVLMLVFYVVFASVDISPVLVAVIAFGLNFGAYAAEIFRSGIEGIDRGQHEAGLAMGFTRWQTFRYIILPQTVRRILPVYKGEFISLVKMTSIVGYIAVQDLTKASDIIRSRTFDAFFPLVLVAVLYFLIAWGLGQGLDHLERQLDPKRRRKGVRA